jgi:hypothetical protein
MPSLMPKIVLLTMMVSRESPAMDGKLLKGKKFCFRQKFNGNSHFTMVLSFVAEGHSRHSPFF